MKEEIIKQPSTITPEERALTTIRDFIDEIHYSVAMSCGLSAWFKAYTQSEDFSNLSANEKGKVFDTYENLKYVLTSFDDDSEELKDFSGTFTR